MMLRNICRHHRQFGRVIWPFSQGHHVPSLSTHQQKAKYASAITERKKFYENVSISQVDGGLFEINLDKRKLKTPGGKLFTVPNEALAIAVATEWDVQKETLKFYTMHLTTLCNTALDNPTQRTKEQIISAALKFLETDTLCYRVEEPQGLVELQTNEWEPVLNWIEQRYNVVIGSSSNIMGPQIPEETKATFRQHLQSYNFWSLTGLEYVITQLKSLILSFGLIDRHLSVEQAVLLSRLEEEYQIQSWGNVEWAHDYDMYELQARTAAGAMFMEFLLGNPYSTPVGQCIERATDGSLQSEDWTLNMEICDLINETEDGPKDAIRAVKKRLNGNKNYREVMLTLTVLETCVKNCGYRFHALVTTRDFIDGVLVKIISPKNNPPAIVQDKVLALIQAWADAFRSSPDLTGVVHVYEEMKRKGIEFPTSDLETLSPIHTPQLLQSAPEMDQPKYSAPVQPKPLPHPHPHPVSAPPFSAPVTHTSPQMPNLPINPSPEQICKLRSELDIVRGNTKVMSEMLTEMVPGQEDPSDHELLQELNRTCRAMQQRIVELISRVSNEEVTEELLHVNDDLNNIFLRYESKPVNQFENVYDVKVLNEATEDNLIDLGPGSPAVVSPRISATPPSSLPPSVAAVRSASPVTLSSRLAVLDVGSDSVTGTLSSLTTCQPQDDFDMFAQTRTGTIPERKNVPFEDTKASSGVAPTLDVRQQNTGVSFCDCLCVCVLF
ncbi:TOM1-like protein [Pimephales promelas]|nr:TOM1-like protein [Pimephales promelas]